MVARFARFFFYCQLFKFSLLKIEVNNNINILFDNTYFAGVSTLAATPPTSSICENIIAQIWNAKCQILCKGL